MKTAIDYLFRVEPPWVFIGFAEPGAKELDSSVLLLGRGF